MRLVATLDSNGRRELVLVDDTGLSRPLPAPPVGAWTGLDFTRGLARMLGGIESVARAAAEPEGFALVGEGLTYDSWHHPDDPQDPRIVCVVWPVA